MAPQAVASTSSYDLVATDAGALLFFSPPPSGGEGIFVVPLGPGGKNLSPAKQVVEFKKKRRGSLAQIPKSVPALDAESKGGKIALAWISEHNLDMEVAAALGDVSTLKFSKTATLVRDLPVEMPRNEAQVRAALSDTGQVVVMARGQDTRCPDSGTSKKCATFLTGSLEGASFRSRMPLVVPEPCTRPLTQGVFFAQSWYYGVCSEGSGQAKTTVYAITFEPEYAEAHSVESASDGLDLVRGPDGVIALDARTGAHAATRIGSGDRNNVHWPSASRGIFCDGESPVIHLSRSEKKDAPTLVRKTLSGPESGIGPWLPAKLRKKPYVRAVWTGEALLVADMAAGEIRLSRHQCREGVLKRTDI